MKRVIKSTSKKSYKKSRFIASLFFIILLTGCEGSNSRSELEVFVNQTKMSAKNKEVEPIPAESPELDIRYKGLVKRSPFVTAEDYVSNQVEGASGVNKPDIARAKEVLEHFDLQELTMVGSLKKNDGTYWALVKDNNNMIYKVKPGNYLGKNFGKIVKITDQNIELNEYMTNSFGGWRTKTVIMTLQE